MHTDFDLALPSTSTTTLQEYINPLYLETQSRDQIRDKCASEQACVSLNRFLKESVLEDVASKLLVCEQAYKLAVSKVDVPGDVVPKGWTMVGPAHKQRYLRLESPEDAFSQCLFDLKTKLLESEAFTRYISMLTCLNVSHRSAQVRRFRPGSDYTVAYQGASQALLDVTLCFVDNFSLELNRDLWDSGEVGGFQVYLDKEEDEDGGDVAVYLGDKDNDGIVSIDPGMATLAIVYRDQDRMTFTKYVGREAPSGRYDIVLTYVVVEEDE